MEFWYYIKVESGQSISDVALQEYGTDAIEVLNQIVIDNETEMPEGISTSLYAGMTLRFRTDYALRNKAVSSYFADYSVNQHTEPGEEIPGELPPPHPPANNETIIEPGEAAEIKIAPENAEAVFLNYLLKEQQVANFSIKSAGHLRIINSTGTPEISDIEDNGFYLSDISVGVVGLYLVLKIIAPPDRRVYFKKHIVSIL